MAIFTTLTAAATAAAATFTVANVVAFALSAVPSIGISYVERADRQ